MGCGISITDVLILKKDNKEIQKLEQYISASSPQALTTLLKKPLSQEKATLLLGLVGEYKNPELMKVAIQHGTDVNALIDTKNGEIGNLPLLCAAVAKATDPEVLRILIHVGVDVNSYSS